MSFSLSPAHRAMSRDVRKDRHRHVKDHKKYRFLVDSTTSTSNDTTINNDEDTTATSFTTITSDNDINEEVAFKAAMDASEPEPIFAVPSFCMYTASGNSFSVTKGVPVTSTDVCKISATRCSLTVPAGSKPLAPKSGTRLIAKKIQSVFNDRSNCPESTARSTSPLKRSRGRSSGDKSSSRLSTELTPQSSSLSASPCNAVTSAGTSSTTTTTTTVPSAVPSSGESSDDGISPILLLWSLLTVLVAGTCTFAFLQPFWVMHVDLVHTFGMVSYCFMDTQSERSAEVCSAYGGYHHLANIPSGAWQAGCVLYGAGCVLLCVSSFLALSNLGMADKHIQRVSLVAGYMQAIAVFIMAAGLLIFPMGFGSNFFRHYCGDFASAYDTGHCLIGWSYMLGIMGTALSVFCPFLSQFTDMRTRDIFL